VSKKRPVAAVVGLIVAVLGVTAAAADARPAGETIRLGVRFADDPVDLGAAGPSIGDELVIHDTLLDSRGRTVGGDAGVCTFTSVRPPVASCVITFTLPHGQIAVQFVNTPPPRKRAAIVGGSGRYRGARGELRILEHPNQTGRLTFRLAR
jgi:hypothetical protein